MLSPFVVDFSQVADDDADAPWNADKKYGGMSPASARASWTAEQGRSRAVSVIPATILSSAEFVAGFTPPDYLVDGILQRGFFYSFTGKTGSGKTAVVLQLAACVARGQTFGPHEVTRGRVLYFAGENPDDNRMRWIAMSATEDFDLNTIVVDFIPGRFKISEMAARIAEQVKKRGPVVLVIVDTSAAYFEGDDENSNAQQAAHGARLRALTELPGNPCVIVNSHPTKNATDDNLIPRGGGAFLAEVDGNLTGRKHDGVVELHWQGKFRGPEFAPINFRLETISSERLRDSKGRPIPTVMARHLSEGALEAIADAARADENRLLEAIKARPDASLADLARALGWTLKGGEPHKMKVTRMRNKLVKEKLLRMERGKPTITDKGEKALAAVTASSS